MENKKLEELKGRMYKCDACGSVLFYNPKKSLLTCEHCNSDYPLTKVRSAIELRYTSDSENGYEEWGETKSFKCRSCGAVSVLNDYQTASVCPFCNTPNVMELCDLPGIKPNAILPFSVSKEDALNSYKKWISSKALAPNDLKKKAEKQNVSGIYVPMFTYDTNMHTNYVIRYGEDYTVVVGSGKNRRTEVRTRWYTRSGTESAFFNDIQVDASKTLTDSEANKLGGFDSDNAVAYHSQFVTGYSAERYSTGLDESWEKAKKQAEGIMRQKILSHYHYDHLDYLNMNSTYTGTTFKYLLVPIWLVNYKYKNANYKSIINGRSSLVTGTYPKSKAKIGSIIASVLGAIAVILLLLYYNGFFG